ncbi:CHID1 [Mytilus edulis]|uniref:Chitinase domain-containing protein 1 n=1 Tax=Mytilus edulis TaxID=6550 RepID=A0A8S3RD12_MYTED|nr:CHID1 [Mytilus edulis]
MILKQRIILLLTILYTVITDASLSPKDKKKVKKDKFKPVTNSVIERGLVKEEIKLKDILKEYGSISESKTPHFTGDILAYVTPWNSHGYDIAKTFSNKFSMVSPVWLQVKRRPGGSYHMQGGHDIDSGWVEEVKEGNTKMVPRVLFDGWSLKDFEATFSSEDNIEDCIDTMLKFTKKYKFDGLIVEIWSQLGGQKRKELVHFLTHMGETFKAAKKTLILVIPPPVYASDQAGMFGKKEFDKLAPVIDGFSLMTYDFSNPQSKDCECTESVLCFGCGKWVHSGCVGKGMSSELTKQWATRGLKFYCKFCCFDQESFDCQQSLLSIKPKTADETGESAERTVTDIFGESDPDESSSNTHNSSLDQSVLSDNFSFFHNQRSNGSDEAKENLENEDNDSSDDAEKDDSLDEVSNSCMFQPEEQLRYGEFLNLEELLNKLKSKDVRHGIPEGKKDNVCFTIDNSRNIARRVNNLRSEFSDDCGVWISSSGSTPKTYYVVQDDGKLKAVVCRQGIFCTEKQINKKKEFIPVDPQPADEKNRGNQS